jgi:hypothetical protein
MLHQKPADVEWPGYVQARDHVERHVDATEQAMHKKRMEARRYLREKMRACSDNYNKAESRVFTPEFVMELGRNNSARRMQRNPWLESMFNGIDEEGKEMDASALNNILPFGPSIGLQDAPANLSG